MKAPLTDSEKDALGKAFVAFVEAVDRSYVAAKIMTRRSGWSIDISRDFVVSDGERTLTMDTDDSLEKALNASIAKSALFAAEKP